MARSAARSNDQDSRALMVQPPRLPMPREAAPAGITPGKWKALVDAVFPSAKTVDGVMLAVSYCRERGLDVFKRPVHVVPMYNSALGREIETVWPGINEYRTTASRTGQWAGNDECKFGPLLTEAFKDEQERWKWNGNIREKYIAKADCPSFTFPEWAQVTVYRLMGGQRVPFVGPKVYFKEIFSGEKGLRVPNARWQQAPSGQLEKCAEAAALRRAFPEELGNDYTAEEMEGKVFAGDPVDAARQHFEPVAEPKEPKPKREDDRAWSDEIQDELDRLKVSVGQPGATIEGLNVGKERYVDVYNGKWPAAALDALEQLFDDAIAKLSGGELPRKQNQEEENEPTSD
jgi:phage recombination protein Bet